MRKEIFISKQIQWKLHRVNKYILLLINHCCCHNWTCVSLLVYLTDELYIMSWELWLCEPPISYRFPLLSSLLIRKNTLNSIKKKNPSIICHFLFYITVLKYMYTVHNSQAYGYKYIFYLSALAFFAGSGSRTINPDPGKSSGSRSATLLLRLIVLK